MEKAVDIRGLGGGEFMKEEAVGIGGLEGCGVYGRRGCRYRWIKRGGYIDMDGMELVLLVCHNNNRTK